MPRADRRTSEMTSDLKGEGRCSPTPGASPTSVPTPTRSSRSGDRREKNVTALEEIMRKRGVDEAWNALEEMQTQGVQTDKYTISRMLMKTVGDNRSRMNPSRVYRGIGLVEKFIDMQPKDVDEVLLNALLDTCCRLKDLSRLESTMQRMRDLKITPSPVTLGILVKTYGQAGDIQKVLQVWEEMEKQRGQANAVTYGCMIDACVKCNHLQKAVEIFKGMREAGKHRNTILYTTLIKGYGLEKDLKSALELFREMPWENVPYNIITYNSIIDACVKGGDLVMAESILHEILSPNSPLQPDLITFSTLLKGYCHSGELDKALQLVEAIKARGLHCDELVYNTLMDGCVKANDITAGVGLFEEMVQNGMRPSSITHSILARLYQRAGYEDDASEAVAQLYQHHGIERPTGGDRGGKGAGRRNANQRSPLGRGGASPTASPMSQPTYGMGYGDASWGAWGEMGYDGFSNASAASTPCASPGHHIGGNANGMFLPMDAMRAVPPMPGMGGSDYGSSCAGATPMGSAYGSVAGSPYMSPTASPGQQVQIMAAPSGAGMPQLPAWPFAGAGPTATMGAGNVAGSPQNNNMPQQPQQPQQPQYFAASNGMAYDMNQAQMANGVAPGGAPPTSFMVSGTSPCWQGQPAEAQQSPFPMPLSGPVDLAQKCTPQPTVSQQQQPSQPQQAYFEFMPNAGSGRQNPFCL